MTTPITEPGQAPISQTAPPAYTAPAAYTQPLPTIEPPAGYFTQAQLDKAREDARSEEKDKLYGRLNSTDDEVKALRAWREQQEAAAAQQAAEQAEAERKAAEAEMSSVELIEQRSREFQDSLQQTTQTFEERLAEEREAREASEALLAKEREFNDLRQYAQGEVEANKESIAPQLLDWIQGNSREEIDAAVQRAIATTADLVADIAGSAPGGIPAVVTPPAAPAGTRPFGGPANLDPATQYTTLTPDQIKDMPMDQYAKIRGQLGVKNSSQGQGLYG